MLRAPLGGSDCMGGGCVCVCAPQPGVPTRPRVAPALRVWWAAAQLEMHIWSGGGGELGGGGQGQMGRPARGRCAMGWPTGEHPQRERPVMERPNMEQPMMEHPTMACPNTKHPKESIP